MKNIDFKKINNQFNLIIDQLDDSKIYNQKIFSVSFDVDIDSVDFKKHSIINNSPYIFSSNNFSIYAFIKEKSFLFNSIQNYKDKKNNLLKDFSESYLINNESNFRTFIFGGFSFDLNQNHEDIWNDVPLVNFILPRYVFHNSKLIINLYSNRKISLEKIKLKISSYIKELEKINLNNCMNLKSDLVNIKNLRDKNIYIEKINNLLSKLKNKKELLAKVVVARIKKATFTNKIPFLKIFNHLQNKNINNMNFLFTINDDISIIGSSPELVLSKTNTKIKSESIAGTNYQNNTSNFISNDKEIIEQKIVTEYINDFFNVNSTNIFFNDIPSIKKTSNIEHFCTSFSADQNNNKNILELLHELHPTPAIAGYPKNKALKIINSFNENRGWYGGPIGWIDNKLNGKFYLNIRSGIGINNDLYLFSGSGITDQSDPENEWIETEYKFNSMKDSL